MLPAHSFESVFKFKLIQDAQTTAPSVFPVSVLVERRMATVGRWTEAQWEAIAVVVSASNECAYCVNHHATSLRQYIDDEETLNLLMTADGLETLEPRLSNIVRHAEKLTDAPGAMTESDLGELRAEGLSDKDILDLTMIVGYFNFVNRIALGLGVAFSEDEISGYIND